MGISRIHMQVTAEQLSGYKLISSVKMNRTINKDNRKLIFLLRTRPSIQSTCLILGNQGSNLSMI